MADFLSATSIQEASYLVYLPPIVMLLFCQLLKCCFVLLKNFQCYLTNHLILDKINNRQIGWKPLNTVDVIHIKPPGGLMLLKDRGPVHNSAPKALHAKVEGWVSILNSCEIIPNSDISIQLFLYLSGQGLLRSLPWLDFSTWEFPAIFVIAISALRGKHFVAVADDSGYYLYCFHLLFLLQ